MRIQSHTLFQIRRLYQKVEHQHAHDRCSVGTAPSALPCRQLKAQAAELIDDPSAWEALFHLEDVRTAAGAVGMLHRAYPGPWRLYSLIEAEERGDPPQVGRLLLEAEDRPVRAEVVRLLNEALTERRKEGKQSGRKRGLWGF